MTVHVLLNLLNELRKRDRLSGLPSIYLLFAASNKGALSLDSIYHKT